MRVLPADAITNGDFARNGEDWVTSSSGITFDKTTGINGLRKPYCNMYGNGNWIEQQVACIPGEKLRLTLRVFLFRKDRSIVVSVDGTRVGTVGLPDGTNQESVFTASVDLTAPDSNKFTLRLTIVGENVRVDDISLKRAE